MNRINRHTMHMMTLATVVLAVLIAGGGAYAQSTVVYREIFPNGSGSDKPLGDQGWQINYNTGAVTPTQMNSWNGSGPTDATPINSNPSNDSIANGYAFNNDGDNVAYLFWTDEYTVDRDALTVTEISWYQANESTATTGRAAIKVDGQWYASQEQFSGTTVGSQDWEKMTLDFTTASWNDLTFVDGSALALGSPTTLPAGDITAFGWYVDATGKTGRLRLDTYAISVVDPDPVVYREIFYENFDSLDAWTVNVAGGVSAGTETLSYSGGAVSVDGGGKALQLASGANDISGNALVAGFDSQSGTVYFSLLAKVANVTDGQRPFVQPLLSPNADGDNYHASVIVNAGPTTYYGGTGGETAARIRSTSNATELLADYAPGDTVFFVGKLWKSAGGNYDRLSVALNPTRLTEPATWTATVSGDMGASSVQYIRFRADSFSGSELAWVDEIRIGTSYESVLPAPATPGTLIYGK